MRVKTRNVTLAVSEEAYRDARLWAARHGFSLSGSLGFLLENLAVISKAVRQIHKDDPGWGKRVEQRYK
jgi:hypothetical protein